MFLPRIFLHYITRKAQTQVFVLNRRADVKGKIRREAQGQDQALLASLGKELCDKLYSLMPVYSVRAFKELLFDDLRIDEAAFFALQKDDILQLAPLYRATNLKLLAKFIEEK